MNYRAKIDRYPSVLGLPENGRFIPATNSKMTKLACLRQFWFDQIEGLSSATNAMRRGTSWDVICRDMYRWWIETDSAYPERHLRTCWECDGEGSHGGTPEAPGFVLDCEVCDGTGEGALTRAMRPWVEALEEDPPSIGPDDVAQERERLYRAWLGYREKYQAAPLNNFRAVGEQVALARPVINPATGSPYCPTTYLIRTEAGLVLAGTAEQAVAKATSSDHLIAVRWPMYQLGTLDLVLRDRGNGDGWVVDAKFSGQPGRYEGRAGIDPQLPGYCWLLDAHKEQFGITRVVGHMYDVVHSKFQSDPFQLQWKPPLVRDMKVMADERGLDTKGLKAEDLMAALGIEPGHGGFSTALSKAGSTPSWVFRRALDHAGLDHEPYEEHLAYLEAEVDGDFYKRPWAIYSEAQLVEYAHELHGRCRQIAGLHRAAVRVTRPGDVAESFPRNPICTMPGGYCSFTGPCSQDGPEVRAHFTQRTDTIWEPLSDDAVDNHSQGLSEELGF